MSERFAYFFDAHIGAVVRAPIAAEGRYRIRLGARPAAIGCRSTIAPEELDTTPDDAVARYRARCAILVRNAESSLAEKREAASAAAALVVEQLAVVDVTK